MLRSSALALAAFVVAATPAYGASYVWTGGGGANTNWSSELNWGGSAPGDNEHDVELAFPALAPAYTSNNDRTGLVVTSLSITTQVITATTSSPATRSRSRAPR